jgi:hypothetical protein
VPAKINADISIPHMNILYIANNEAYSEKFCRIPQGSFGMPRVM